MPVENRLAVPVVPEQNRAAPEMRELKVSGRGVQAADAFFEIREHFPGFRRGGAELLQISGRWRIKQARAPNDGVVGAGSTPQIGQVDRVKRLASSETER